MSWFDAIGKRIGRMARSNLSQPFPEPHTPAEPGLTATAGEDGSAPKHEATSPAPARVTKSDLIRAALAERYPDKVLPKFAARDIAAEFGVTRQLVSLLTVKGGYTVAKKVRTRRGCASCGTPLARGHKDLCSTCVMVPVACEVCGKIRYSVQSQVLRKFRPADIEARARRGESQYTGRFFCSRECFGTVMGKEAGWGSPDHPIHRPRVPRHGTHVEYTSGCRCEECRAAYHEHYMKHRDVILARSKAYYQKRKAANAQ